MATIFPLSASVNQVYQGYEFDGTSWNIIGVDLTVDYALDSELTAHEVDTTNVHGIADTSVLSTISDVSSASALAYSSASSYVDSEISSHNSDTTSVHGIADTSLLATISDVSSASAESVSSASALAYASASSYADSAISNLVDSAPETLNTLNELAAALGDDANFATTITTSLSNKASASTVNDHISASTNVHGIVDMGTLVSGSGITNIVALTQAEYDALTPPDATTLYVVTD